MAKCSSYLGPSTTLKLEHERQLIDQTTLKSLSVDIPLTNHRHNSQPQNQQSLTKTETLAEGLPNKFELKSQENFVSIGENAVAPPPIYSGSTTRVFRSVLSQIDLDSCKENGENAFYVCDLAEVYKQILQWKAAFGDRVEPFFAVKCNPDIYVLRMFARLGLGFDCASHAEIDQVLRLGVPPSKIIYANPCKANSFIRHARDVGVEMMTFDNADELQKVSQNHPGAKMVLRILTDDGSSIWPLGQKFGAPLETVRDLLVKARDLSIDVIGVAFHVGSGCTDPNAYIDAVGRAKWAFEVAAEVGFNFNFLDVGGGFLDESFPSLAQALLEGLDQYFPVGCGVRVMAEPGQYFVTKAFELATNIIARRQAPLAPKVLDDGEKATQDRAMTMYYINDGVYGSFSGILVNWLFVEPIFLTLGGNFCRDGLKGLVGSGGFPTGAMSPSSSDPGLDSSIDSPQSLDSMSPSSPIIQPHQVPFTEGDLQLCKIFGPSCDSGDLVCPEVYLPVKQLKVGDWIRWKNMGAYTICIASQFNGFKISEVKYTIGDPNIEEELRNILGR